MGARDHRALLSSIAVHRDISRDLIRHHAPLLRRRWDFLVIGHVSASQTQWSVPASAVLGGYPYGGLLA